MSCFGFRRSGAMPPRAEGSAIGLALTVAARSRIAELERTVATIAGLTAACETDVRGV